MIPIETRNPPSCLTAAFGRVFYASGNRLYFSRLISDDINNSGRCYQVNDPTSDELPDLLATDGGELQVNGSDDIIALRPFRLGVLAFSSNGVWYLSGPEEGFSATAYTLNKISSNGLYAFNGIVDVGSGVMYAGPRALHLISLNESGVIQEDDITTGRVEKYYKTIVSPNLYGTFDRINSQVWFIRKDFSDGRGFIFDLRYGAFYPQKIERISGSWVYAGAEVDGSAVFAHAQGSSLPSSTTFRDYGVDTSAYLLTQPESLGKFALKKAVVTMTAVFNRTETRITGYTGGAYVYDLPSSCVFQAQWDYDSSDAYGRYTTPFNVYRVNRRGFIPQTFPWDLDDGQALVYSKFPVSGSGTMVQYKFTAESGKDMQMLGYTVDYKMKRTQ